MFKKIFFLFLGCSLVVSDAFSMEQKAKLVKLVEKVSDSAFVKSKGAKAGLPLVCKFGLTGLCGLGAGFCGYKCFFTPEVEKEFFPDEANGSVKKQKGTFDDFLKSKNLTKKAFITKPLESIGLDQEKKLKKLCVRWREGCIFKKVMTEFNENGALKNGGAGGGFFDAEPYLWFMGFVTMSVLTILMVKKIISR